MFPGAVPGTHAQTFRKPWEWLSARAGIANLRLHDVRRTLGSWLSKAGVAMPVIKAAMGHQDITTTAIYARSEDADVRRAMEAAAQRMLQAGNGTEAVHS